MSARPSSFVLHILVLAIFACCGLVPASAQIAVNSGSSALLSEGRTPPADFVFQKRVDEVNLLFTVVDQRGRFISDLKLDDFEILDDQRAPEKVRSFRQESDLPLRVALVIDMSSSVNSRFTFEQQSAIEFFKKILRPEIDKAMVVGFNENVHLEQDLTNDLTLLSKAVNRLHPDGETALYDAVVFAADKLHDESEPGSRRVIILISDGDNNTSHAIMNDAEQAALRAEASIFAFSTNTLDDGEYPKGEAILELLSRYTGGEILPAREKDEVVHAFRQVEQALRSQYVLSYKPAAFRPDGRYRAVALNTRRPHLKVECRHGYFAPHD